MTFAALILTLCSLVAFAAWIWLLVVAFRVSVGWGLALFFLGWTLIPLVVFAVQQWETAKRPVILYAASCLVMLVTSAVAVFALGLELGSMVSQGGGLIARSGAEPETETNVLPPPRPTAQPTHPSWEAIVREIDRDDDATWETFVPSPTPITGRPGAGGLSWDELGSWIGKAVVVELSNGTVVTAALEAVEPDRLRVRHVIGGGEAAYWVERDQVDYIRPAK
jgi:hypothetical protein